jgi:hypothetical protein
MMEKEILEKIKELAKENPNDFTFGSKVRALLLEIERSNKENKE